MKVSTMNVPESGVSGDMPWSGGELSFNNPIREIVVIDRQLAMAAGDAGQAANVGTIGPTLDRSTTHHGRTLTAT